MFREKRTLARANAEEIDPGNRTCLRWPLTGESGMLAKPYDKLAAWVQV